MLAVNAGVPLLFLVTIVALVELEDQLTLSFRIHPTPDIFEPSQKWMNCGIAISEHRPP